MGGSNKYERIARVYGAGFDRDTERHVTQAGLELTAIKFVPGDTVKLITARVR